MPARLKDIAKDLNLSVVTISKVLRDHPDISQETRQRVLKRMKELNYRPNLAARALVTGRSYIAGLVVPDLVHPFFGQVAKGLSQGLRKKGYSVVLSSSEDDPELERQEIELLLARRVDVLIVASTQSTVESFQRLTELKVPYVLIDRKFDGLAANFVGVDDGAVGALATTHLIDVGCRRIAHIGGPEGEYGGGAARWISARADRSRHARPIVSWWRCAATATMRATVAGIRRCSDCWQSSGRPMAYSASMIRLRWAR